MGPDRGLAFSWHLLQCKMRGRGRLGQEGGLWGGVCLGSALREYPVQVGEHQQMLAPAHFPHPPPRFTPKAGETGG